MDCGPACLRMAARYYGKTFSFQYLREKSYVTREGASLLGLRDAAVSIGMEATCVLASLDYLEFHAKLPCIVHWDNDHFVVVYKITNNHVYVADPAYGKAKYHKTYFLSHWASVDHQGYTLLLNPTDEFYSKQENTHSKLGLAFLLSHLKPYRNLLVKLLLAMLLGSFIQLVFPFATQMIVDKGVNGKDINFLCLILLGQFLLVISRVFVSYIRSFILFHISTPLNISLVRDFLIKLTKLPVYYFDVKMIGDTIQRISDHQRVESFITATFLNILLTAINVIVFGIVLAIYRLQILVVFIVGIVVYLIWIRLFLAKRREIDFAKFKQMGKNQSAIIQLIMGMQEIRLNNCEKKKISSWAKIQDGLFSTSKKSLNVTQRQQLGCSLIQETQNIIITFISASLVISGDITLGMMLSVQFILGQLNGPVEQLVQFIASAQDAKISLERIEEIHNFENEEPDEIFKKKYVDEGSDIIISNVSFQHEGPYSEMVLRNVSCIMENSKITAIVGASGSGKTTLLKLILGIYKPLTGDVRIGNTSLSELSNISWRNKCGLVMQDGYIFSDTIAGNIALSDEIIDENKLKRSAETANISNFVERLPSGYKTKIGAEGHGLSQGQKQRILIARSVYKDPDYIFFDEATNSLDTGNERTVMRNLNSYFKNKTVVIVAHRLSTVKNADKIIVLDNGLIVESGTHDDLINIKGAYYNLIKDQIELMA